jgi:hypothetical protein
MRRQSSRGGRGSSTRGQNTSAGRGRSTVFYCILYMLRQNRGVDRTAVNGGEHCSAFRLYRDDSQWFSLSNSALSCAVLLYEVESQLRWWEKM